MFHSLKECFIILVFISMEEFSFGNTGKTDVISNFECIRYNYEYSDMECTWHLQQQYRNQSEYRLKVTWSMLKFQGVFPCYELTWSSCKWTFEKNPLLDYDDGVMNISLNLFRLKDHRNLYKKAHVMLLENQVKPEPVENLQASASEGNCIDVHWYHPINWKRKIFRITYKDLQRETTQETEGITDGKDESTTFRDARCGLLYNTHYGISVECKPLRYGFWSEAKQIRIKTMKNENRYIDFITCPSCLFHVNPVPSRPPLIPKGSFTFSEMNTEGNLNVTLYWLSLQEALWNGDVHRYQVAVYSSQSCTVPLHPSVVNNITSTEVAFEVKHDCDYTIHLKAQNEIGLSENASVLNLPRSTRLLKLPQNVIIKKTASSRFNISWSGIHHDETITYTVLWCKNVLGWRCKGGIRYLYKHQSRENAELLPENRIYAMVNIPDFPKNNYRVGVSANVGRKSSGFKWSECFYENVFDPPSLVIVGHPENESVEVSWELSSCGRTFYSLGYKFNYHVQLCHTEKCNGFKTLLGVKDTTLLVPNVIPGRRLCVKVFISHGNDTGPASNARCYTQRRKQEVTMHPLIIGVIVLSCVCAAVLLISGLYGLHKIRKDFKKKIPVEIPLITRINIPSSESSPSS